MDSIANPSYLVYEYLNYQNDTNLIEKNRKNNTKQLQIPK